MSHDEFHVTCGHAYAPTSYIVLTEHDDAPLRFISGQEHKKVATIDILPLKPQT